MVTRSRNERDESNREEDGVQERVVKISRVSKVVKGGRRLSFSAVVVVGEGETCSMVPCDVCCHSVYQTSCCCYMPLCCH